MTVTQPPLRFLFVAADKYPPFRPDVEILFGQEFRRRGHQIEWVLQASDSALESGDIEWRGFRVSLAATEAGRGRFARVKKHLRALANEIRAARRLGRREFDFVQVKDKFLSAFLLLIVARFRNLPFFYWLSFPYPEASFVRAQADNARYPVFYRIRGFVFAFLLYRVICRFATHVFVQSEEMKRSLGTHGVGSDRMTAVPMGVDLSQFEPVANTPAPRSSSIVYLGSLGRERHLEFLVDAFARVRKQVGDARLILIGEGDEREDRPNLERYVAESGLSDDVEFTGFMSRTAALEIVGKAAVGASPIRPTPMYDVASPTKILEYMAAGVPAVANDQPDQRDVLAESGGGLCTPYDVEAFADALITVLNDPARAAEMGRRGRAYVGERRSYTYPAKYRS